MARLHLWSVKDVAELIDKMQENNFDCIMFIEGNRGLGKSTLTWKIATRCKVKFRPKKDIHFSRKQVIESLATNINKIIFADEMINVTFNRDFYEQDQKQLIKGLNMYRDSCNIFLGCIPKFINLDNQIQDLCKIKITVIRRGFALIHVPKTTIYDRDKWDTKYNQKIETNWAIKKVRKPNYAKLSTVVGYLIFGDLSPAQKRLYASIKNEKRNKIFLEESDIETLNNPKNTFYIKLIERMTKGEINKKIFTEICLVNGRDYKHTRHYINQLLEKQGKQERFKDLLITNKIPKKPNSSSFTF